MEIDFQKVADAIEKSSQEIKNLMFSSELGKNIEKISEKNGLDEETSLKLADEIGYVILDIKPRSIFLDSLSQIGIEKSLAGKVLSEIETEIFSELDKVKNKSTADNPPQQPAPSKTQSVAGFIPRSESGVGQSFEQIILNQARAMRPAVGEKGAEEPGISDDEMIIEEAKAMQSARPADESDRIMNHESGIMNEKEESLSTEEKPKIQVPDYSNGQDPYREPLN